jgi:hypothetical protein
MDMLRLPLRVMLIAAITMPVSAQTRDNSLRAIGQFALMIEEFDEENTLCGLTRHGVGAPLLLPASSAKFEVVPITAPAQIKGPLLYLRIDTVMARSTNPAWPVDACISTVQLSARVLQDVTLEATQRRVFGTVLLWSTTSMAASPRSGHAKVVGKEVEKHIRSFIGDWNSDNKAN